MTDRTNARHYYYRAAAKTRTGWNTSYGDHYCASKSDCQEECDWHAAHGHRTHVPRREMLTEEWVAKLTAAGKVRA